MNCEIANMYKFLGEKVGNTNLPRNLCQFKIEIEKMCDEIIDLNQLKEHYKQKFIQERDENRKLSLIQLKEIHYKQMKEENENLKKENKEYLEKCLWAGKRMKEILEFTSKIREERDKVKSDWELLVAIDKQNCEYRDEKIKKLEEENEKLKEKLVKAEKDYRTIQKLIMDRCVELDNENIKLKNNKI